MQFPTRMKVRNKYFTSLSESRFWCLFPLLPDFPDFDDSWFYTNTYKVLMFITIVITMRDELQVNRQYKHHKQLTELMNLSPALSFLDLFGIVLFRAVLWYPTPGKALVQASLTNTSSLFQICRTAPPPSGRLGFVHLCHVPLKTPSSGRELNSAGSRFLLGPGLCKAV